MTIHTLLSSCALSAVLVLSACFKGDVSVYDLSTGNQSAPLAVGTTEPEFSWKIFSAGKENVLQESYRILVASDEKLLKKGKADLWDSGDVKSSQSLYVNYAGQPLSSRKTAYWKVSVSTSAGKAESAVSSFGTGLLDQGDWSAMWIGGDFPEDNLLGNTALPARYLRKEFRLKGKVASARLYISGLGLYEAYVNGERLSPSEVLAPTLSDYKQTVYYNTFDLTSSLSKGKNVLAVVLGNGRFVSMRIPGSPNMAHYGTPRLIAQLEVKYKNGTYETIISDPSWKITADGPIRSNNEFDGEVYDAAKEMPGWTGVKFNDRSWKQAEPVTAPGGKMMPQPNPNIAVQQTLEARTVTKVGDSYIIDMGQNMVGWLSVKAKGMMAGDKITLRFAESLSSDGSLYTDNLRSAKVEDTYIVGADGDVSYHPTFVYHGFRYASVTGLRNEPASVDFTGEVFYDRMPMTGSFECSDPVITEVHRNAMWGIRGNYRGMPTDCPQRDERMGWLGDRTTGCYGESYIFGNHLLYSKWLDDIAEAQKENGSIPDVAPAFWSLYSDNMTWPGAFITVADMLYRRFGDPKPIVKHYPAMKKWLLYMKDNYSKNGIMTKDTYGDWCMPPESQELIHSQDPSRITDGALISTAFYYRLCRMMRDFATIAGHPEDVDYFLTEAARTKTAFNSSFLDKKKGYYGNNTVTANILPLSFGLVPDEMVKSVKNSIIAKTEGDFGGHVSTGVVGIQNLMRGLTDMGAGDLAVKIASNTDYPSWGYMAEHGATTIWELWNGDTADPAMNSGNHVMLLADLVIWDYEYLGGISPAEPGFKKITLRPRFGIGGLTSASCSYDSVYGLISSSWTLEDGTVKWNFEIPANTTAEVWGPDGRMKEYGSGAYTIIGKLKK